MQHAHSLYRACDKELTRLQIQPSRLRESLPLPNISAKMSSDNLFPPPKPI